MQMMKAFFDNSFDRRYPHLPTKPSDDEIRMFLEPNNRSCPLNDILVSPENEGNMRIIKAIAFTGLTRWNHSLRGCNFGLFCPPGQGKTFIAKKFAATMGLPFVFVQSPSLQDTWDLFQQICKECEKCGTPIKPDKRNPKAEYLIPPAIVFLDEAHFLKDSLQKGSLLNPMEMDDGYMHVKTPGSKGDTMIVDCKDICWIAATTDRGDLFDAFDTRLLNRIEWASAGPKELPHIILSGLTRKVEEGILSMVPPLEICAKIGNYSPVPRLAIHGVGPLVVQQKRMLPSLSWDEAVVMAADSLGIDAGGLDRKQLAVLTALGQRPIAEGRLGEIAKCRTEQVRKYVMPGLMQYTNGGPFVVSVTGRGMCITESGLAELDKRGISHKGHKITAQYFENRR